MSLWCMRLAAVIILLLLPAHASETPGEWCRVLPKLEPDVTVSRPGKSRLTYYSLGRELASPEPASPASDHEFCALSEMNQGSVGNACSCRVRFHDGCWVFERNAGYEFDLDDNMVIGAPPQHCSCRAVCWDLPKAESRAD